jgi:hypothetical protein
MRLYKLVIHILSHFVVLELILLVSGSFSYSPNMCIEYVGACEESYLLEPLSGTGIGASSTSTTNWKPHDNSVSYHW